MEPVVWLLCVIVLIICELATMGLTTIWFAGGALAAFLASLFHLGLPVQIILFVVVSLALLLLFRPLAKKYVNDRTIRTNAESLVGQAARITETVNNDLGKGTAVVNGLEWTARSEDGSVLNAGTMAEITAISGVKLILKESTEVKAAGDGSGC